MAKVLFLAVILIALIGYGALFMSWNTDSLTITAFDLAGQVFVQDGTVGQILLVAAGAGALLMALLLAGLASSQRLAYVRSQAKLEKARRKLEVFLDKIKEQRQRILELEDQQHQPHTGAADEETALDELDNEVI